MSEISYLGPLRDRPQRSYQWRGNSPTSVGPRGENTVAAILAARRQGRKISRGTSRGRPYRSFEENLGFWLEQMGVIDEFAVEEIASGTDLYELMVTVSGGSTRVSVMDVGFGVSQVLPVLVQVFYAPAGILEQPEIHLHPAAQSALGDVLLAAIRDNNVQLIVETHGSAGRCREDLLAAADGWRPAGQAVHRGSRRRRRGRFTGRPQWRDARPPSVAAGEPLGANTTRPPRNKRERIARWWLLAGGGLDARS